MVHPIVHRLIVTWQQNKRWEERFVVKGRRDVASGWDRGIAGAGGRWKGG